MQAENQIPPGPRGLPVIGSIPEMYRDPLGFYRRLSREYYGIVRVKIPMNQLYVLTDPECVEALLVGKHRECVKDVVTAELRPLVGQGLLTSDGDPWRRQRKLAAQPFAPKSTAGYADEMVACAEDAFSAYRDGEQCDFHQDIMGVTLKVVGKTLLGFDTESETQRVAHAMEAAIPYFEQRLLGVRGFLPASIPWRSTRHFRTAKRELDEVVSRIIARAQRDNDGDYLLARLIRAREESGKGLSAQVLADEALTMLLAGHETTALAIMFAVYSLCCNPAIAVRLREEIDQRAGGRSLNFNDLAQLPLLEAVVKETLRLYPPAPVFAREVAVPITLGKYDFPRGAQMVMSPYAIQRDPRHFKDPERFDPDRFLDGSTAKLPKFAYFPFGGGPRICIGQHFAMMEAQLLLGTLLQHVEMAIAPGFKMELEPVVTLRSRYGLPLVMRRRSPVAERAENGQVTQPSQPSQQHLGGTSAAE